MSYSMTGSSGSASTALPGCHEHPTAHRDRVAEDRCTLPVNRQEGKKTTEAKSCHVRRDTMRTGPSGDRARSVLDSGPQQLQAKTVSISPVRHVLFPGHDTFRSRCPTRIPWCCTY